MKTLLQGGYIVGFNGKNHEILQDGEVVYENDTVPTRPVTPALKPDR